MRVDPEYSFQRRFALDVQHGENIDVCFGSEQAITYRCSREIDGFELTIDVDDTCSMRRFEIILVTMNSKVTNSLAINSRRFHALHGTPTTDEIKLKDFNQSSVSRRQLSFEVLIC